MDAAGSLEISPDVLTLSGTPTPRQEVKVNHGISSHSPRRKYYVAAKVVYSKPFSCNVWRLTVVPLMNPHSRQN